MKKIRHMSKKLDIVGLYLNDYRSKINGRQIAKSIGVSAQTALNNLNEMGNVGILSSEMLGRNKEYYLNLKNPIAKEFVLIGENYSSLLLMADKEILPIIKDISGFYESLIIFGSFADGSYDKDSDIDMMFVGKADKDKIKKKLKLYPREINSEFVSFKEFRDSLKDKKALAIEILKKHVIFGCIDKVIDIFMEHYLR